MHTEEKKSQTLFLLEYVPVNIFLCLAKSWMCMYVFSNPTINQEKLELIKYYCVNQDSLGNFAVTNGLPNLSGSHYIPQAGQLCSLESLRDHADGQSILMCVVQIRKTGKGQDAESHTGN